MTQIDSNSIDEIDDYFKKPPEEEDGKVTEKERRTTQILRDQLPQIEKTEKAIAQNKEEITEPEKKLERLLPKVEDFAKKLEAGQTVTKKELEDIESVMALLLAYYNDRIKQNRAQNRIDKNIGRTLTNVQRNAVKAQCTALKSKWALAAKIGAATLRLGAAFGSTAANKANATMIKKGLSATLSTPAAVADQGLSLGRDMALFSMNQVYSLIGKGIYSPIESDNAFSFVSKYLKGFVDPSGKPEKVGEFITSGFSALAGFGDSAAGHMDTTTRATEARNQSIGSNIQNMQSTEQGIRQRTDGKPQEIGQKIDKLTDSEGQAKAALCR